jgi:DNA-binding Lrp family transcriptional regulator
LVKSNPENIKKKRIRVDDSTFLKRLVELEENRSALARELNISPAAVVQRLKKLDPDGKRLEMSKAAGVAAGIIHKSFEDATPATTSGVKAISSVGFEHGVQVAADRFKIFDRLVVYCDAIDEIIVQLKLEMEAQRVTPKSKLKPYHVDLACKLVDKAAKLAEVIHRTLKDVSDAKSTTAFFEAAVRVFEKYSPDARRQIYLELSRIGEYEQADFLYTEPESPIKKEGK